MSFENFKVLKITEFQMNISSKIYIVKKFKLPLTFNLPLFLVVLFSYLLPFRGRKVLSGGECNDPENFNNFN